MAALYGVLFLAECKDFLILVVIFIGGYGLYSGMLATLLGLILLFVCRNELSYVDHCCGCSNQGQGGAYGGDAGGVY